MEVLVLMIHLFIAIALVVVVLLQKSEGGALGIGGGGGSMQSFLTGRGASNILTRITAFLAAAFFVTSITLVVLAQMTRQERSIFDAPVPAGPIAPSLPEVPLGEQPVAPAPAAPAPENTAPANQPTPAPAPASPEVPRQQP